MRTKEQIIERIEWLVEKATTLAAPNEINGIAKEINRLEDELKSLEEESTK